MIKLRYRLFPGLFIKKILNIIKKSKDRETAKVNLKQKLKKVYPMLQYRE